MLMRDFIVFMSNFFCATKVALPREAVGSETLVSQKEKMAKMQLKSHL